MTEANNNYTIIILLYTCRRRTNVLFTLCDIQLIFMAAKNDRKATRTLSRVTSDVTKTISTKAALSLTVDDLQQIILQNSDKVRLHTMACMFASAVQCVLPVTRCAESCRADQAITLPMTCSRLWPAYISLSV